MRKMTILLLLCVLGALLHSSALGINVNGPTNCCFKFYPRRIDPARIISYNLTSELCARSGVVFQTKSSRSICVDPNNSWVQNIMKRLDEKSL